MQTRGEITRRQALRLLLEEPLQDLASYREQFIPNVMEPNDARPLGVIVEVARHGISQLTLQILKVIGLAEDGHAESAGDVAAFRRERRARLGLRVTPAARRRRLRRFLEREVWATKGFLGLLVRMAEVAEASSLSENQAPPPGCDGYAREKDAGSSRSSATVATEDALSRRPVLPGGRGLVFRQALGQRGRP
jgi:hypothetical protein